MNKKIFFVLILFLPAIIAGIWLMTSSVDTFTPSSITVVSLVHPDGTTTTYTNDTDKEFFADFNKSIVSIEKQEYNPDVYSLYQLIFERVSGDVTYSLCLSADIKNCLAFDEHGSWYRIDKEYAKQFLAHKDVSEVYLNSSVPVMLFTANGTTTDIPSTSASWYYLLADETYSEVLVDEQCPDNSPCYVVSGDGFEFDFDVSPDWYNVKIFDGDSMVYDGLLNSVTEFSYNREATLRAEISAEWYEDTTPLYHGEAKYSFSFDYDIKATYTVSKDTVTAGDAVYISLNNADGENLEITSDIPSLETLTAYDFADGQVIIVPVPMATETGEYRINVKSDRSALSVPINVNAKDYGTVKVGFIGSETAGEYNLAFSAFMNEISDAFNFEAEINAGWLNGLLTPVQKYVDGVEQYWVSAPSYGVKQTLNGVELDGQSIGIHYVKAVSAEALPVRSVADGVVVFSGSTTLYGNTVIIEHGLGFKSVYGHLDNLNFKVGDSVQMGASLGNAKPSGFAVSSTELFFGICVGNTFLSPYNFITEPRTKEASEISEAVEFLNNMKLAQ